MVVCPAKLDHTCLAISRKNRLTSVSVKIFDNGRSQAVKLPKEYGFESDKVIIIKYNN